MTSPAVCLLAIFSIISLGVAACQGSGSSYAPPPAAEQQQSGSPAYPMGPGMMGSGAMGPGRQQNFGMMSQNMNQMGQMMGQGYMHPEHQQRMMGMMGQMGSMMQEMGGPNYTPEMEQRHRQQLQEMQQGLSAMKQEGTIPAEESRVGAGIFNAKCAGCHRYGGNSINADLPIRGSAKLSNLDAFLAFVRHPRMPDGSRGAMPAFSPEFLSNLQAKELYQYLRTRFGRK
jgi:mono/diheme cytochrome c family protein